MAKPRSYPGTDIEISFDMRRCIHARNCFLGLPQVFNPARRPWVAPDAAPAEEIAAIIRSCPSGALTFRRLDGGGAEQPKPINRGACRRTGRLKCRVICASARRGSRGRRCAGVGSPPTCLFATIPM